MARVGLSGLAVLWILQIREELLVALGAVSGLAAQVVGAVSGGRESEYQQLSFWGPGRVASEIHRKPAIFVDVSGKCYPAASTLMAKIYLTVLFSKVSQSRSLVTCKGK